MAELGAVGAILLVLAGLGLGLGLVAVWGMRLERSVNQLGLALNQLSLATVLGTLVLVAVVVWALASSGRWPLAVALVLIFAGGLVALLRWRRG